MRRSFRDLLLAYGVNYFDDDLPLKSMLKYLGYQGDSSLSKLGLLVSTELAEAADYIDHYGRPVLHTWNPLGERIDYVRISPEHKRILSEIMRHGVVTGTLRDGKSWLHHYLSGYIISEPGLYCTVTVTMQTAYALRKYGDSSLRRYLDLFLRDEDPWLGATFYSEVQGGSDLGANRTRARLVGDKWLLSGDKYFTSNVGLADAALVTARPEGAREGPRGIALFFVPAYRDDGSPNYRIRRLKNKLGTILVPTGEVELDNSEGYLLGDLDNGIYIALEVLTIARIDNALGGVGGARKSLWEAYRFANRRRSFGKLLVEHPLMLRDFLELEAELEANTLLSLKTAQLFDKAWRHKPPYGEEYHHMRLLSHIVKNLSAWAAIDITGYVMEIFGGIGFFEEFPIAKHHRDAHVGSIWEGTSNIHALDMLEVMARRRAHEPLLEDLEDKLSELNVNNELRVTIRSRLSRLSDDAKRLLSLGYEAQYYAKEYLRELGETAAMIYLLHFATWLGEDWAMRIALIYAHRHMGLRIPLELLRGADVLSWMA